MEREALKLALEALEGLFGTTEQFEGGGVAVWRLGGSAQPKQAIIAIKETLAQPAQGPANDFYPDYDTEAVLVEEMQRMAKRIEELEAMLEPAEWLTGCPTCGMDAGCDCDTGTWNPPQREWVGLTAEERQDIALEVPMDAVFITEAKLKERNHGT